MKTAQITHGCSRAHVSLVVFLLLALAGCKTAPSLSPSTALPFAESIERHERLRDWRYSAKSSIISNQGNEQINIDWSYSDQAHSIRLFGPLGIGAVKIEYDQYAVQMSDNKGLIYSGSDAHALLYDVTGLSLPITSLQYWLFAVPEPNSHFEYQLKADDQGDRQISLRQHGWTITFSEFVDWPEGEASSPWPLPQKIAARGFDANGEPVRIKIFTKSWDFSAVR